MRSGSDGGIDGGIRGGIGGSIDGGIGGSIDGGIGGSIDGGELLHAGQRDRQTRSMRVVHPEIPVFAAGGIDLDGGVLCGVFVGKRQVIRG